MKMEVRQRNDWDGRQKKRAQENNERDQSELRGERWCDTWMSKGRLKGLEDGVVSELTIGQRVKCEARSHYNGRRTRG